MIITGTLVPQPNNILLMWLRGSHNSANRPKKLEIFQYSEHSFNYKNKSLTDILHSTTTTTMVNLSSKYYRGVCILKQSFTNLVVFDTITSFIHVHWKIYIKNPLDCKELIGCNKATDCDWNLKIWMNYVMFHSFIVDNIRKVGVILDEKETCKRRKYIRRMKTF